MVTVASWNVENLFSTGEFAATIGPKLDGIVSTVLDHDVDIVGLQEVGDQQALDELLPRLGQDWHGVLSTHPDHRGIRVAVVSRLPETSTEQVVDLPAELAAVQVEDDGTVMARMGRGAVRMGVQTAAGALDVVSCHLKSKLITYPDGRFAPVDEAASPVHRLRAVPARRRGHRRPSLRRPPT